ncbi:MAG TPA: type 1 glutamine amidotransferase [Verrucomicrobiae bacterium]|jgi:GMP synthase-like glutamine amidotransferase|nr:type 1 glutamine amidotransferase [Verrucomicrobiae bacterium]
MKNPKALLVKNITREGPGLIEGVLRELKIPFDLVDLDAGDRMPRFDGYGILIVFGGPDSANDETPKIQEELVRIRQWLDSGRPYLGICLGLQLMVKALGGEVYKNPVKELGFTDPEGKSYLVELTDEGLRDPLFVKFRERAFRVFQLHGETVKPAPGAVVLGTGKHCRHQVVRAGKNAYGIQCHFELTPALLEDWAASDPDLLSLAPGSVLSDYVRVRGEYERVGKQLMLNFFSLAAGVSAPQTAAR